MYLICDSQNAHSNTLAKAAQRHKEQAVSSSSSLNSNSKRPLAATPSDQGSQMRPGASSSKPLERDSRLGTYFEYDLSKMVNSKGGFLMEEGHEVDENRLRKEKEREKQRNVHNLDIREAFISLFFFLHNPELV